MRWPGSKRDDEKEKAEAAAAAATAPPSAMSSISQYPPMKQIVSWTDSLSKSDWQQLKEPNTWIPPALAVGAALGFSAFYRTYLRRIPNTNYIQPRFFRRRSLLGKVTSVGDGDNFHMFHTPGGRLTGWGWLRKVPAYRKDLKGQTIPVRIAGVDAPEGAHFGRPAQPYSGEALDFLTQYLLGRRVRAYLYRRDQYDRVVARVMVRRFFFFRKDVGIEMLKRGLATCYEAKTGAEFGGRESQYRVAEAKAKARKRGIWSGGSGKGDLETPREYKTRMAAEEAKDKASTPAASTAGSGAAPASVAAKAASPATAAPAASSTSSSGPGTSKHTGATAASTSTSTSASSSASSKQGHQNTNSSWGKSPQFGGKR